MEVKRQKKTNVYIRNVEFLNMAPNCMIFQQKIERKKNLVKLTTQLTHVQWHFIVNLCFVNDLLRFFLCTLFYYINNEFKWTVF